MWNYVLTQVSEPVFWNLSLKLAMGTLCWRNLLRLHYIRSFLTGLPSSILGQMLKHIKAIQLKEFLYEPSLNWPISVWLFWFWTPCHSVGWSMVRTGWEVCPCLLGHAKLFSTIGILFGMGIATTLWWLRSCLEGTVGSRKWFWGTSAIYCCLCPKIFCRVLFCSILFNNYMKILGYIYFIIISY